MDRALQKTTHNTERWMSCRWLRRAFACFAPDWTRHVLFWGVALLCLGVGCGPGGERGGKGLIPLKGVAPDWSAVGSERMSTLQQAWKRVEGGSGEASDWGQVGMLLSAQNLEGAASICLSNAMVLDGVDVKWPYLLAMQPTVGSEAKEWLWSEAVKRARGVDADWVRYRQALFWAEEGRWADVEVQLAVWVQGEKTFAPARLLWAQALWQQGKVDRAREVARSLTGNAWCARAAWGLLAQLELRSGNAAASQEASQRQAQSPPQGALPDPFLDQMAAVRSDALALAHPLHELLASQRLQEAEPRIQQLVIQYPTFAEAWMLQGRMRLIQGRLGEAEEALRRSVQLDDTLVQGWFQLGLALLRREQWQEAVEVFRKATVLKPGFGPAWYNLGYALARKGDREGAVPAFQQAIRFNPENVDSYVLLADLYRQLGRTGEMGELLDRAEVLRPGDRRVAQLRKRLQ